MDFLFFEGEAVIIVFRTVLVDFFYSIVIYLTLLFLSGVGAFWMFPF